MIKYHTFYKKEILFTLINKHDMYKHVKDVKHDDINICTYLESHNLTDK